SRPMTWAGRRTTIPSRTMPTAATTAATAPPTGPPNPPAAALRGDHPRACPADRPSAARRNGTVRHMPPVPPAPPAPPVPPAPQDPPVPQAPRSPVMTEHAAGDQAAPPPGGRLEPPNLDVVAHPFKHNPSDWDQRVSISLIASI